MRPINIDGVFQMHHVQKGRYTKDYDERSKVRIFKSKPLINFDIWLDLNSTLQYIAKGYPLNYRKEIDGLRAMTNSSE